MPIEHHSVKIIRYFRTNSAISQSTAPLPELSSPITVSLTFYRSKKLQASNA